MSRKYKRCWPQELAGCVTVESSQSSKTPASERNATEQRTPFLGFFWVAKEEG